MDLDNFEQKLKEQKKKNKTSFDSSDDEAVQKEKELSNMSKKKSVTVVGSDNIVPTPKSQSKINESHKVLEGINEEVIEQENINQDQEMDPPTKPLLFGESNEAERETPQSVKSIKSIKSNQNATAKSNTEKNIDGDVSHHTIKDVEASIHGSLKEDVSHHTIQKEGSQRSMLKDALQHSLAEDE